MENKMAINVKSVFKSGLVAGFIIIVIGFGLVPILGNQMDAVLESRSLPPLSKGAMGFFAFVSIAFGISVIWLYALIQDRFKSKLKAAVAAALIFWFYAYFLPNAALVAYGFMPFSLSAIGTAWGILEVLIASLVASRLYKPVN
jgi:hypothetical protein